MAKHDSTWMVVLVIAAILVGMTVLKSNVGTQAFESTSVRPDFDVKFVNPPNTAVAGKELSYQVEAKNVGSDGTLSVDSGIYPKEQIESWYGGRSVNTLFAVETKVVNKDQCVLGETNVQRFEVTLATGASKVLTFKVTAPTDVSKAYYLHAGSFEACWRKLGDEGYRKSRVSSVPVVLTKEGGNGGNGGGGNGGNGGNGGGGNGNGEPFSFKEWWDSLGSIKYALIGLIVVLLLIMVFPGEKKPAQ